MTWFFYLKVFTPQWSLIWFYLVNGDSNYSGFPSICVSEGLTHQWISKDSVVGCVAILLLSWRIKLLYLPASATKKEAQWWVGQFGIWRQHIHPVSVSLQLPYWVSQKQSKTKRNKQKTKLLILSGVQNWKSHFKIFRLPCNLLCHMGCLAYHWCCAWSIRGRKCFEPLASPYTCILVQTLKLWG